MLRNTFVIIGDCPLCGHKIFDGDETRTSSEPGADYIHKSCLKKLQKSRESQSKEIQK